MPTGFTPATTPSPRKGFACQNPCAIRRCRPSGSRGNAHSHPVPRKAPGRIRHNGGMPFARLAFRFFILLFAGLVASAHAAALPDAFTAALKQAGIPLDHVAVVVQPLDADAPLLSHNADAALNPASVMKLVTSFAALNQLGPGYVWTTDVWADGTIADGVLNGNLIIKGYGDPGL